MRTKILLLFTFAFLLVSCEDSSSTVAITSADIVGTWNLTKQEIENGQATVTVSGQTLVSPLTAYTKDMNTTFTFLNTPSKLVVNGTYTLVSTATTLGAMGTQETMVNTSLIPIPPSDWILNGTSIVFTNTLDFPAIMSVEDFSANSLTLKGEVNISKVVNGMNVNTSGVLHIELER